MKRTMIFIAALMVSTMINAQNLAVDQLFEKYAGTEGFTTLLISKGLFKVISEMEEETEELNKSLKGIESIRILALENDSLHGDVNFFRELKKNLDFSEYEELMVVHEDDQDVRFVMRHEAEKIAEMLLIVGGDDNVLISIVGDINFSELAGLAGCMPGSGMKHLNKLAE